MTHPPRGPEDCGPGEEGSGCGTWFTPTTSAWSCSSRRPPGTSTSGSSSTRSSSSNGRWSSRRASGRGRFYPQGCDGYTGAWGTSSGGVYRVVHGGRGPVQGSSLCDRKETNLDPDGPGYTSLLLLVLGVHGFESVVTPNPGPSLVGMSGRQSMKEYRIFFDF